MNPLPIEYRTGLPALIAPTIEQVKEMFPPLVPIQLSPDCAKFLTKVDEFSEMLSDKFDRTMEEKERVMEFVKKYGAKTTDVMLNPLFAVSSREEYDLLLRIKDHMRASQSGGLLGGMLPPEIMLDLRAKVLSSVLHQLNFPAMCRDLISRYETARFDVNDYTLFVYGRKPKQVMVYGYKMPDYRFQTSRHTVVYDSDLNIIDDGGGNENDYGEVAEKTTGYQLAKEWAEENR